MMSFSRHLLVTPSCTIIKLNKNIGFLSEDTRQIGTNFGSKSNVSVAPDLLKYAENERPETYTPEQT